MAARHDGAPALDQPAAQRLRCSALDLVVGAVAFSVALGALAWASRRALEVLVLEVREGDIVRRRGRASAELLREIGDVVERSRPTGRIVLRLEGGRVMVRTTGIDETTTQRLRNVVGRFPTARLKTAPRL